MKKTTMLLGLILLTSIGFSQENNSNLMSLLERYYSIPANGSSLRAYFTNNEISILKSHIANEEQVMSQALGGGDLFFANDSDDDVLVSFSATAPDVLNFIGFNSSSSEFESAGDIDPTDLNTAYALTLDDGEFYEIDLISGDYTFLGLIDPPGDESWNGIEFDPQTNILYAVSSDFDGSSTLSSIDIDTITATTIGSMGIDDVISIATDGQGNFYAHTVIASDLYSVDISTGQVTLIGDIGFVANFGQDLEWDPVNEIMYMSAFNAATFDGELRTVDLTTGNTTFIGEFGTNGSQVPWMAFPTASTLSIHENVLVQLKMYPNPTNTDIIIDLNSPIEEVKIYNISGQLILQKNNEVSNRIVDVSELAKGSYIIQIKSNGQLIRRHFLKN